jgi:hypothetical protein
MAKVRILVRPTGAYNGQPWPKVGETIDLPDIVAEGMVRSGDVEVVTEPVKAEKAADKAEKRPAAPKNVEKRKA